MAGKVQVIGTEKTLILETNLEKVFLKTAGLV